MRAHELIVNELSLDDMHDFVDAWQEHIDDDVSNEHYVELGGNGNGGYVHLFVGGYPEDGFTEQYAKSLAGELDKAVRPHGWFVAKSECKLYDDAFGEEPDPEGASSQVMCFIDVFPLFGKKVEVPEEVWHVCRSQDAASIEEHGLNPSQGGNDHIQTVNGRIYVCTHQSYLQWIQDDFRKHREWKDLDVFKIDTENLPNIWHEDVEWGGSAAWTAEPIPSTSLTHMGKLDDWITY